MKEDRAHRGGRGAVLLGVRLGGVAPGRAVVFRANGITIGDVPQASVIVWTRLTQHPVLNRDGLAFPEWKARDQPSEARPFQGHALDE